MNVSSATQSSYLAQMQSSSQVQSQSGASGMPPPSATFGSIMQGASNQLMTLMDSNKNGSIDKVEFSNAAKQLAQSASTNANGSIGVNELLNTLTQSLAQQKSDAMAVRINSSNVAQTPVNTQISGKDNMQSILMKNILSAYGTSNTAINSGSLSLKA